MKFVRRNGSYCLMNNLQFCCPCHFGLESVLAYEIRQIGGENIAATDGKVIFEGNINTLIKANICLRTAERVLIVVKTFKATSFEELFEGTKSAEWEKFIPKTGAFPVKGFSLNSKLFSIPDCQSIIKKAIVERLKSVFRISWLEETGAVFQVRFSIFKDQVMLMLDSSGAGLHKRGWRRVSNAAPIKETLAAGLVDLARVRDFSTVYDPFCGSGTIVIEAALKAMNIAPGLNRRFASENWPYAPKNLWNTEKERCVSQIKQNASFSAFASDIDPSAIEIAKENAKKAGVAERIHFSCADITEFKPESEKAVIICNPPYGERLFEVEACEKLYKTMGGVFPDKEGQSYYIIASHDGFEQHFGRTANKRRKLYNGMLKCQLFMYF